MLCFTDSEETITGRRTSQAQFESIAILGLLNLMVGSLTTAYMNILLSHASQTKVEILFYIVESNFKIRRSYRVRTIDLTNLNALKYRKRP